MYPLPSELSKLAKQSLNNSNRWFGENGLNLTTQVLGLISEVGNVADILQSINMGTLEFTDAGTRYKFGMELADVFIYFLNICALTGMDPEKLFEMRETDNNRKYSKRELHNQQTEIMDGVPIVRPS